MRIADILILTAGFLWTIESVPQILKILRTKKTEGLSLLFFGTCFTAYILFLTGTIIQRNWSIMFANLFPFINMLIINFLIIKYRRKR